MASRNCSLIALCFCVALLLLFGTLCLYGQLMTTIFILIALFCSLYRSISNVIVVLVITTEVTLDCYTIVWSYMNIT